MYDRILVTLDGSALAEEALPHAVELARRFQAELFLLQVISFSNIGRVTLDTEVPLDFPAVELKLKSESHAYLDKKAGPLVDQGLRVRCLVERGGVAGTVLDVLEREKIDLLVLTSHGRSGLSKWVHGSVAEKLLQNAPCPIVLIRSKL